MEKGTLVKHPQSGVRGEVLDSSDFPYIKWEGIEEPELLSADELLPAGSDDDAEEGKDDDGRYPIGTRVRVIANFESSAKEGMEGTVVSYQSARGCYGVDLGEGFTFGHSLDGAVAGRQGYWIAPRCLTKIAGGTPAKERTFSKGDVVEYTRTGGTIPKGARGTVLESDSLVPYVRWTQKYSSAQHNGGSSSSKDSLDYSVRVAHLESAHALFSKGDIVRTLTGHTQEFLGEEFTHDTSRFQVVENDSHIPYGIIMDGKHAGTQVILDQSVMYKVDEISPPFEEGDIVSLIEDFDGVDAGEEGIIISHEESTNVYEMLLIAGETQLTVNHKYLAKVDRAFMFVRGDVVVFREDEEEEERGVVVDSDSGRFQIGDLHTTPDLEALDDTFEDEDGDEITFTPNQRKLKLA